VWIDGNDVKNIIAVVGKREEGWKGSVLLLFVEPNLKDKKGNSTYIS